MFRLLKWMLTLLVIAVLAVPFFAIESEPLVYNEASFDAAKIDQAKAFLYRVDPRRLEAGEFVTQWIDEQEIKLAGDYLLSQLIEGGMAVEIHSGYAVGQVSIVLPENPIGRYLNASLVLSQSAGMLSIESLSLGRITLPNFIAEPVRQFAHEQLMSLPDYNAAIASLNGLQLLEDRMLVMYQWNPALVDRLKDTGRDLLVDEKMRERLLAYTRQIRVVAPTLPREISLGELMAPVFILAQGRSGDAIEENRAALLALSFYFSGVDVARMFGVSLSDGDGNLGRKLTLFGRSDFTQHFLTSAALTLMSSSGGFADSIGLFKELDDAKGGSGFSFTDIGADRAGVRVAELAVSNQVNAKYVQKFFASGSRDADYIPDVLDLPELMSNSDFVRDYGGIDDPRYQRVISDIEERLAATKILVNAP